MNTTLHLLTCNTPSPYTGTVYPLDEVRKMVEKYNKTLMSNRYGILAGEGEEYRPDMPLVSISHTTDNLYLDNIHLMANVTILDTPAGKEVKDKFKELRLSPSMVCDVDDSRRARNIELIRTDFILNIKEE